MVLAGHAGGVASLAFSPDGTRIVSASYDRTLRVWDAGRGVALLSLPGHTRGVLSVAFSPDGTRIASGGLDRTVRLWDTIPAWQRMGARQLQAPVDSR